MRNLISNRHRSPKAPSSPAPRQPDVRVGWLTEREAVRAHRIEVSSSIGRPMEYSEMLRAIKAQGAQKCVRVDDQIVAFALFDHMGESSTITRIAVDPSHRRRGYGRMLIDDAVGRLDRWRPSLVAEVRESMVRDHEDAALGACRFLARVGFRSSHVADRFGADPLWMFVRRWNPMEAR